MKLKPTDREALQRAIELVRRESALQRQRIDDRLASGESWDKVARGCAYQCQIEALGLAPWQLPPTYADPNALKEAYGHGEREAAELLQRLTRAGVSRYEPDPIAALAAAERKGFVRQDKPCTNRPAEQRRAAK